MVAGGVTPVVADVTARSTEGLGELLRGHDAVVWSAGAGGGSPQATFAVDRDAAIRSMDAAKAVGVERYVMVSYLNSRPDHGVAEGDPFFAYAEAKAAADEHLRASGLAYTILGPGLLTSGAVTGLIDVVEGGDDTENAVDRAHVAAVVASSLVQPRTIGRTIGFRGGDSPIAQALRG